MRGIDVMDALEQKKLKEDQKQLFEGEITKAELETQLLKHMKNNSAPGIDGFTVAWVKAFWTDLSDICTHAINECYRKKISLLQTWPQP
jgi:hypothetical protein